MLRIKGSLLPPPSNYKGYFNPLPEIFHTFPKGIKTGGQRFFTKTKFWQHIQGSTLKQRLPANIWNPYFKFCVERNPFDKVISHYYFKKNMLGVKFTFDDYLNSTNPKNNCINHPYYTSCLNSKNIISDKVIQYYNLNNELGSVFEKLRIPFNGDLPIKAKSNTRNKKATPREFLKPYQIEKIKQKYKKEIELFGYTLY